MATETVHAVRNETSNRWMIVLAFLVSLVVAEAFVGFGNQEIGLTIHILLIFALIFVAVYLYDRDRMLSLLLTTLTLAPMDRVLGLGVPQFTFSTLQWLGLVAVPLLVAAAGVAYVEGMRPSTLGLGWLTRRNLLYQAAIALTAIPLGLIEFYILRPTDWVQGALTVSSFLFATVILFFATGLSEEIIFRGIMLPRATEALGVAPGLLFVTAVFASLHLFYRNAYDLVFVFCVGLFYAVAVVRTKSLWGVILSHTFANVILYVIAPFFLK